MVMPRVTQSENVSEPVVNVGVEESSHRRLVAISRTRGMKIKEFMTRWVRWFDRLDVSEQAIVLDQIARDDAAGVAELVLKRRAAEEMRGVVESALAPAKVPHAEKSKAAKAG